MATTPAFAAKPFAWAGLAPATLDASLTAPTNVTTLGTAETTTGSKVDQIVLTAVGTTVAGVVNIFLHDGTTYHLIDQFLVPVVTSSTTARAWQSARSYTALVLPKATPTWTLRFTVTVAGLQSMIKAVATGGDLA